MSPVGFRFRPSVKELIEVLEFMACHGDNVDVSQLTETPGDISKKELYGDGDKEPWKLFGNDNEWDLLDVADTVKKKVTYVVTRLPKMKENKVARKAGNGTWVGQTQPTVFEKDGEEVACMKSLSYLYSGRSSECYYYMHEYYLCKPHLQKISAKYTDYVICRIVKDTSKSCRCRRNINRGRVNPIIHHQEMPQHHQDSGELAVQDATTLPPPPISYASLETFLNIEDDWMIGSIVGDGTNFAIPPSTGETNQEMVEMLQDSFGFDALLPDPELVTMLDSEQMMQYIFHP